MVHYSWGHDMEGVLAAALINGAFQLIEFGMAADEVNTKVQGWVDAGMSGEQIRDAIHDMMETRRAEALAERAKHTG